MVGCGEKMHSNVLKFERSFIICLAKLSGGPSQKKKENHAQTNLEYKEGGS